MSFYSRTQPAFAITAYRVPLILFFRQHEIVSHQLRIRTYFRGKSISELMT